MLSIQQLCLILHARLAVYRSGYFGVLKRYAPIIEAAKHHVSWERAGSSQSAGTGCVHDSLFPRVGDGDIVLALPKSIRAIQVPLNWTFITDMNSCMFPRY